MSEDKQVKMTGIANFLFVALNYVKNVAAVQKHLKKKDLDFVMVLNAEDWPNPGAILFRDHELTVKAIKPEDLKNKDNYDTMITATGQTFFDYFMHRIGIIRPILLGKMKVKGMLNILKVFWFILVALKVFSGNQTLSEAFFHQLYPH